MTKLVAALSAARWISAAAVAYLLVHAAADTFSQLTLSCWTQEKLTSNEWRLAAIGTLEIVAAFGLFARPMLWRMFAAAMPLLSFVVPILDVPMEAISGWCVSVATAIAVWPKGAAGTRTINDAEPPTISQVGFDIPTWS